MNRGIKVENTFGTNFVVAAMTFCVLALLPGCGDIDPCALTPSLCDGPDSCDTDPSLCIDGDDGDGGGDDPAGDDPINTPTNVAGRWTVTEIDSSSCDDPQRTRTFTWDVTQNGSTVTVFSVERGESLIGTITGNTIDLQGIFLEDGGITNVSSTDIAVSSSGNTVSGTETWTWSDGVDFCSGTTLVSGSRN